MTSSNYERIYFIVKKIPMGRVATYGQVAVLATMPGAARQVGYALHALADGNIPWHRVINAKGEISRRGEPMYEDVQRRLLEREGVKFDDQGRVSLQRYRWEPRSGFFGALKSRRRRK